MDDLNSLIGAEYNPRTISKQDFKNLYDSIGQFGDMSGLVFNRRTGRIVGGHQRKEAYLKHGGKIELTETLDEPNEVGTVARGHVLIGTEKFVYRVVDWPQQKEKLANLAANKIQGDWDDEKLAALIYELKDAPELPEAGFTIKEITEVLASVMQTEEDENNTDIQDGASVKVTYGDIFELGGHRLMCGDVTVPGVLDALMDGEVAEMVFTDPPYNVEYKGSSGQEAIGKARRKILNDKMESEVFLTFLKDVCKNLMAHTRGAFYICMSSSELHHLYEAFTSAGGHWQTYIIWVKNHFVMGRRDYQSQFEPILYGLTDAANEQIENADDKTYESAPILYGWNNHAWYGGRRQGDTWLIDRPSKSPNHPTEKPLALCARAIKNSSQRTEIVLDGFGGSGSTLIACEQLERRCRTVELDPRYVDVIIRRWEAYTGKKARLIKNIAGEL